MPLCEGMQLDQMHIPCEQGFAIEFFREDELNNLTKQKTDRDIGQQ